MDPNFAGSRFNPIINARLKHKIPGLRRWKSQRKQLWLILAAMALCFFLMEMVLLLGDSLRRTQLEHRLDAYGEWQLAIEDVSAVDEGRVRALPLLERAGAVWTVGDVVTGEILNASCLGGMDADAVQLARLSVLEGRLPEDTGEAAVEASLLNKLDKQLGDTVTLEVELHTDSWQEEEETVSVTLTVCGVLKDYTAGWCIGDLPGVLITEATAERNGFSLPSQSADAPEFSRPHYLLLMKGKEEWTTIWEDMDEFEVYTSQQQMMSGRNSKRTNYYAYPEQKGAEDNLELTLRMLRLFILGLNTLILYVVVRYSVRSRQQEFQDLRALGATAKKLRGTLVREGLSFCLVSLFLGISLAVLLFFCASLVLPALLDTELYFAFSWQHVLLAALLGMASVFVSYLIPIWGIRRLAADIPGQKKKAYFRRQGTKRRTPGKGTIWLRGWTARPLGAIAQVLLLCAILLFPCIGIHMAWAKGWNLPDYMNRYGGTYTWDSWSRSDDRFLVAEEKVSRLQTVYGVADVRPWHSYSYDFDDLVLDENVVGYEVAVDLRAFREDPYVRLAFQEQTESQREHTELWREQVESAADDPEIAADPETLESVTEGYAVQAQSSLQREADLENGCYPVTLMGTSHEKEIQRCLRNLGEGDTRGEAFRAGKAAILLLPAALQLEDANGKYTVWEKDASAQEGGLFFQGGSALESISLRIDGVWSEIPVCGVIYGFQTEDHTAPFTYGSSPFSLIVSDSLFETLVSGRWGEDYSYVAVDATSEADAITDRQVAGIFGSAEDEMYTNNRLGYEQRVREFLVQLGFSLVLGGGGMALCLMIFYQLQASRQREQREQWELLSHLGMKNRWRRWMAAADAMVPSLAAIGLVTIGLSSYYTWEYNRDIAGSGRKFQWALRVGFDLPWYGLVCALYLGMVLAISQIQRRKKA